ncbi:Selenocysteine lyase/Cysteine desulfurase [Reichenbachiella faecimaris]|uniref:Selenocysteine lyase/Cysteine desulfurase n=1 Tax=Reichenbachiella faecimaris TaxID=692418 RepID=A0A1W2G722_REIFA|nr:aminotransferase class V-fold PLP-dependent enzyme [Reichenbachiella faecimaris]SMD32391.1 Selenocysteine lyase/Cysteine desulfurase [Reichenbachiella faecimaris]
MRVDWNQIRANYQLPNEKVFFETPYFGAMSDATVEKQMDCIKSLQTQGNTLYAETIEKSEDIREKILEVTNAKHHHAALIGDVSTAMVHLADRLSDKKIVLLDQDFPSVTAPWVGRKCNIEWIAREGYNYPLDKIEEQLKRGAEVLVLSWVMYNSGLIFDLKVIGDMCKKYGAIFIVDGTQGLGPHELDLSEVYIDVFLATCYKWLLAGYGTGVAIARQHFEEKYPFEVAGHCSIVDGKEDVKDVDNYVSGVRRFELGHVKTQQVFALHQSLHELLEIGFENIQTRTKELHACLVDELSRIDIELITPTPMSSNILMIEGSEARVKALRAANVAFTHRHGLIRLGIYFYNNEKDIERLIQALK